MDEQESHLALHVAEEAELVLGKLPTTAAEDLQLLQCTFSSQPEEYSDSRSNDVQRPEHRGWLRQHHSRIAIAYRAARKLLLARVASDLRSQAWLLMDQ